MTVNLMHALFEPDAEGDVAAVAPVTHAIATQESLLALAPHTRLTRLVCVHRGRNFGAFVENVMVLAAQINAAALQLSAFVSESAVTRITALQSARNAGGAGAGHVRAHTAAKERSRAGSGHRLCADREAHVRGCD